MSELRSLGIFRLLRDSVALWQRQRAHLLSAALAYYMVFSLSPLLVLSLSIASVVFRPEEAAGGLVEQIGDVLGEEVADSIQQVLDAAEQESTDVLTWLISTGILLFGASLVFRQLKLVLDIIWDAVPDSAAGFTGILGQIKTYLYALLVALCIGLLLLSSLTLSTILTVLDERILDQWSELGGLLNWAEVLILWLMPTVLFAIIFKVLPDVTLAWRDVWLGTLVTTVLFTVGTRLVALYLRYRTLSSPQEAAGTLVVLLLWLYYSAQIFLMGAAFTRAFSNLYGSRLVSNVAVAAEE
jgi:membrane protein